jgi:capsular exopolysaccharide synthesis family protein
MLGRKRVKQKLGEKLVQAGKISQDQLVEFLEQQHRSGRYLGELVVEGGHITLDELCTYLPRGVARRRLLVLSERNALAVTEFYLLQTALKFTLFSDEPIRTLLVTSAVPGEGKTICASYLARTLARVRPGRFLLVDADLVNPTLHTRYDVPPGPGWTDYLVNGRVLDECLSPTDIDNLQVLPAGSIPPNPGAIFASKKMKEFVDELKDRFDLVVFDSSPLLPVSAAALLAANLDAALMVVKAGSTKRQLVKKAVALLNESRTRVIGVVLNQVVDNEFPEYAYKHSGRRGGRGGSG